MKMHHGYDYVVCASDVTAEHFCEAFRVDRSRIVKYGLPRIDYIRSVASGERHDETLRRILTEYPQLKADGKKTVLYAPTFRRGKAVDVQSLAEALDPEKYDLVVKLHPLYRADASQSSRTNVIYDDEFSSYDWLAVADIIISDYSSYVIESTLADKPLYIYAYDLEDYAKNTGLNIDFDSEPIAPYVFRDAKALAESIGKGYDPDALRAFRDRYIDINTDNCTADLAEFILSLAKK
jgi:CDP-ribitol ribitolphosphotransferase